MQAGMSLDGALRLASLAPFDFAQGAPSNVEGLRAFDVRMARHERACGSPKASCRRVEWCERGDSALGCPSNADTSQVGRFYCCSGIPPRRAILPRNGQY